MKSFGERISYLRNKRELSQEELAKILKIGKSTLGMYETDKREPNHEMTAKIAEFFDVSIDWLTTGKEKESVQALPEEFVNSLIKEAETEYKVNLRDDPVVESALRDLISHLAKMKQSAQKEK